MFEDNNQAAEELEAENEALNDAELAMDNPSDSRRNEPAPDIEMMDELVEQEQSADLLQIQPAPA